jgi:small subunit ribosomal protein S9
MFITESFYGSGGRKRANARVFLTPIKTGAGKFTVNKKDVEDYFPELAFVDIVSQPLSLLSLESLLNQYNIKVTVKGGGKSGQRDAIRLGLAKALLMLEAKQNPVSESLADGLTEGSEDQPLTWRRQLRKAGMLTRDSRKVERKKYGLDKARKRAPLVKR